MKAFNKKKKKKHLTKKRIKYIVIKKIKLEYPKDKFLVEKIITSAFPGSSKNRILRYNFGNGTGLSVLHNKNYSIGGNLGYWECITTIIDNEGNCELDCDSVRGMTATEFNSLIDGIN